ncbi:MAG: M48 family metalloprotease [Pseudomonadota bacterium]
MAAGASGVLRAFVRQFTRVILLGMVSVALAACIDPQAGNNDNLRSSWVRPEDPQEQIGRKEHPAILTKYGGEYSNPKVEVLLAVIVGRLVAVSDDPNRVYKITVLNSPKVNAFALPGGYLYVTRGLLALANDASEVAAVVAHEMAHVSANHAIIRQEKVSSAAIGDRIASEVLQGSTASKVAVAANRVRLSKFSQEQEYQADTIGIRMAGRAGYDPFAAERFLATMQAYRQFLSGGQSLADDENFASSHPSTPKRMELARRHARFFGSPGVGERDVDRYLDGIDGMLFGDTPQEGFVRGRNFAHTGLGITFQAPEKFVIDNQSKAVLISGPGDITTRFDATVVSTRSSLSDYLQSGWISGLVEETIREQTINGLPSAVASARGDGWRFKVRVIKNGSQLYRFVTAAPQTSTNLDAVSRQLTGSFRVLSDREIKALKPLAIRIVKYDGRSESALMSRMRGTNNKRKMFKLLNGLQEDAVLQPGQRVKIIAE